MAERRPNILWISFEDTSPRFGCYGDPVARTPHVDKLAAEGCVFPNTFSTAPVCAPARVAIITGQYAAFLGAHHMRTTTRNRATSEMPTPYECVPPHYVRLLPHYLRGAGYYCTNNAKTDYQFTPPVTGWNDCSRNGHWRNRPNPDQPFFAVFNLDATHESRMWDEHWEGREPKTDPTKVTVPPFLPDTPIVRKTIARQYDNIAERDVEAGMLLAQLEEDGLADNTIVFVWSDHGEGLPRHKRWPYDSGVRVPMIVRWPGGLKPGTKDERVVSTIDLGATILALVGLEVPSYMQGQPFLGPAAVERQYAFSTRDRYDEAYDMVRAVRDRRYRYLRHMTPGEPYVIWNPYRNRHPAMKEIWRLMGEGKLEGAAKWFESRRPAEELYDCAADPHQVHNLAKDPVHREALERMRKVMDEWQERYDRFRDVDEADMMRRWYPNGRQPRTAPARIIAHDSRQRGASALGAVALVECPAVLQLHCPTQGASMEWMDPAKHGEHWQLYTGPIAMAEKGRFTIRTRAHRIGFEASEVNEVEVEVR